MSNADVIREWYRLISIGDTEGMKQLVSEDVDWNMAIGFPAGGRYVGKNGIFDEFYERSFPNWSSMAVEVDELVESGDTVISLGRYVGTASASGTPFKAPFVHVCRIRDGRMIACNQYVDTLVIQRAIEGNPIMVEPGREWVTRITETPLTE